MRRPSHLARILVAVLAFVGPALAKAQSGASFAFTPPFPMPGTPVHFTDTSCCSPTTWLWNFDDPSSSENGSMLQNPTHTYNQPGTYSVTLLVSGGRITVKALTVVTPPFSCVASPTVLCLNNHRFAVDANWTKDTGETGAATGVKLTEDSGYFWFFDESNIEMVVKVLNGCALDNAYWVFAAGLTNVQVDWQVVDTQTGAVYAKASPQGTPFQPVQATDAFPNSCP